MLSFNESTVERAALGWLAGCGVLFLNGQPVVVFEPKNAANATIGQAYHQLRTCYDEIGPLFTFAGLLVISDGTLARLGLWSKARSISSRSVTRRVHPAHSHRP